MEEIRFESLNELYTRLYPAFNTKKLELKEQGLEIREIDLWNYFKENVWAYETNLTIYDMVGHILKVELKEIKEYIEKIK